MLLDGGDGGLVRSPTATPTSRRAVVSLGAVWRNMANAGKETNT